MSTENMPAVPVALELPSARNRRGAGERRYWKSLDEIAETPAFLDYLHREFPEQASMFEDPEGRREFMKIMGASLALAGLTACTRQPDEKIVPYVKQPEDLVPGKPLFFATAVLHRGFANGVLVESHLGRPTKIEGNPEHPQSLGATDVFGQAQILSLYDPDRSQTTKFQDEVRPYAEFLQALRGAFDLEKQRPVHGAGIRLLTGSVTSPTLEAQIEAFLRRWLPAFARGVGAPPQPQVTEQEGRERGGEDAVYYGTKLRGATNGKAKRLLGFAPRRLQWLDQ
jgi:molybdopterin-containing oxidoreductase family iron-sulfur binding subunit